MNESLLIAILLIIIYIFLFINKRNVIYVESHSGYKFLIYKDSQKREKTILLSNIVDNMFKLRNHLINDTNSEYAEYWEQLRDNFNENRTLIYETDPSSNLTSYSVNKGEEVSFCLKSKRNEKLHHLNLMMYVAIHEMAHFACPEIGHGPLFKKIFRKMTEEAIKIGIYYKEDYSQNPIEYCGMTLSSSII
jgi:predicted metal-dependent hydrolase